MPHRARAALRALSALCSRVSAARRAGPPLFPPRRPSATAAGFFFGGTGRTMPERSGRIKKITLGVCVSAHAYSRRGKKRPQVALTHQSSTVRWGSERMKELVAAFAWARHRARPGRWKGRARASAALGRPLGAVTNPTLSDTTVTSGAARDHKRHFASPRPERSTGTYCLHHEWRPVYHPGYRSRGRLSPACAG